MSSALDKLLVILRILPFKLSAKSLVSYNIYFLAETGIDGLRITLPCLVEGLQASTFIV
tara:strand:- start:117 stop:293 length:177 start_codon:yes stop_codon:yes gene_type:complete